jgi:dimethylamine/trimethylamine dehydrogenase
LLVVSSRKPNDDLYQSLLVNINSRNQFRTLERIGDCEAPGIIAQAVYSGFKAASNFGADSTEIIRRRERLTVL